MHSAIDAGAIHYTGDLHGLARKSAGAVGDFVIEVPDRLLPIEVKASRRVGAGDARHLRTFLSDYPEQALAGLLFYDGEETFWVERGVLAAPWHRWRETAIAKSRTDRPRRPELSGRRPLAHCSDA